MNEQGHPAMKLSSVVKSRIRWGYCVVSLLIYPVGNLLNHQNAVDYALVGAIMCFQSWDLLGEIGDRPIAWRFVSILPLSLAAGCLNAPITRPFWGIPVVVVHAFGLALAALIIWAMKPRELLSA